MANRYHAGGGARHRHHRRLLRCSLREGRHVTAEVLPPATEEMQESVRRFAESNADFLEEMKRLGD
jgi:hypothetical protein